MTTPMTPLDVPESADDAPVRRRRRASPAGATEPGAASPGAGPSTGRPQIILRAVSLIGIDSVRAPRAARVEAWDRLASELPRRYFDDMVSVIGLDAVVETAAELLAGRAQGRVLVDLRR